MEAAPSPLLGTTLPCSRASAAGTASGDPCDRALSRGTARSAFSRGPRRGSRVHVVGGVLLVGFLDYGGAFRGLVSFEVVFCCGGWREGWG